MSKRKHHRASRRTNHHGTPQPRPLLTLDHFAQATLAEYSKWQAVFVLCTKPAENPDDDDEENGELACKYRPGYDLRLLVKELRAAADMLERTIKGEDDEAEKCESCGTGNAVDFVSIELAINEHECEEEAFGLCAGCAAHVRGYRNKCELAKTAKPEDGTATGCALVFISPFDEGDADDFSPPPPGGREHDEQWILCGEHAADLTDWLHSDEPDPS